MLSLNEEKMLAAIDTPLAWFGVSPGFWQWPVPDFITLD
jgi:hypothetical protein